MTNMNFDNELATLWGELKTVVEKYERSALPEVRKSAISFGKIIETVTKDQDQGAAVLNVTVMSARALCGIEWVGNQLADVLREMLAKTDHQGAQELLKAVGVVVGGALQVQERGGTGHTLVVVEEKDGDVRVQAQKYTGHASRRV